jgi:hypothetical protein
VYWKWLLFSSGFHSKIECSVGGNIITICLYDFHRNPYTLLICFIILFMSFLVFSSLFESMYVSLLGLSALRHRKLHDARTHLETLQLLGYWRDSVVIEAAVSFPSSQIFALGLLSWSCSSKIYFNNILSACRSPSWPVHFDLLAKMFAFLKELPSFGMLRRVALVRIDIPPKLRSYKGHTASHPRRRRSS